MGWSVGLTGVCGAAAGEGGSGEAEDGGAAIAHESEKYENGLLP